MKPVGGRKLAKSLSSKLDGQPNVLAGWDIGLAAIALACMTSGFWRLWPGALMLSEVPLAPMIVQAGLAALGFVAIATRWEETARALAYNPFVLVLLVLACASAIWAIIPATALRNAIMLIAIWSFGIALALRFRPRELAEICAFAGFIGLLAQFAAHQSMPPVSAFDGDVAFAITTSAWAAWRVPSRRLLWLIALGGSCVLGFAAGDSASLGAAIGLIIGLGFAKTGLLARQHSGISIIVTAWALVVLTVVSTLFALFGADPLFSTMSRFLNNLGPHMMIGQGFGLAGQSVANSLGVGLGIVGVVLSILVVFATLVQALFGRHRPDASINVSFAIWLSALGAIIVSPTQIAIFGPIIILFVATSFSISLSCVGAQLRHRQSLTDKPSSRPLVQEQHPNDFAAKPLIPASKALNAMGLRPKN